MKLGELLVHRGVITPEQLSKALNAQLIYGAHLGTCLIELGYLEEDTLGLLLSDVFRVRYAHRDLLQDIPAPIIKSLSPGVAERLRAIPFDLKDKTLHVTMIDPRHLPSLDELSFASGYRIEAWVSPEVRIFQAMERYYEVPRKQRYIVLAHQLDKKSAARPAPAPPVPPVRERTVPAAPQAREGTISVGGSAAAQVGQEASRVALRPVENVAGRDQEPAAAPSFDERLAAASEELCRANDRARLAKVVLNHARQGMSCCVLFAVDSEAATIWDSRGLRLDAAKARGVRLAFPSEPLLELLLGEPCYRGPVPDDSRYRGFFEVLGIEIPREILLLPIYHQDRIAALFYGSAGSGGAIEGGTEDYVRLMRKLALALDLLALKERIQSA